MEWELISLRETGHRTWKVSRMRVPGGWLASSRTTIILPDNSIAVSEAMCFVPDPEGEWMSDQWKSEE